MDRQVKTKQEAYDAYADMMEEGNHQYAFGNEELSAEYWKKANEYWDLYFYWDQVEEE